VMCWPPPLLTTILTRYMNLYDINKRYIDDSLRYYICEVYITIRHGISSSENDKQIAQEMLDRQALSLVEKRFIKDWKVNIQFSDKATRRDMTIDNLLHGTDDEVEEFIEVAYQMTDRSFHSVRVMKRQLDDYVPV
jgi:hypothetical protein